MKRVFGIAILGFIATSILPVVGLAHHSIAQFTNNLATMEGTVVEYRWVNPHVHMTLQVDADSGDPTTVGTWDIEGASTNIMARQGWTRASFKAGDKITVIAHPLKDGTKGASMFYVILPDGKRLYQDIARPKAEQ